MTSTSSRARRCEWGASAGAGVPVSPAGAGRGPQAAEEEQAGAHAHEDVGDVEDRPVGDVDEVDHVAARDPVEVVAGGPREDQGQRGPRAGAPRHRSSTTARASSAAAPATSRSGARTRSGIQRSRLNATSVFSRYCRSRTRPRSWWRRLALELGLGEVLRRVVAPDQREEEQHHRTASLERLHRGIATASRWSFIPR